jgi:nicotinamide-nucleotide amidase
MPSEPEFAEWTEEEGVELKALLVGLRLRVAAAESLTAGRVQALLGAVSGASGYFAGGVTTYTGELKQRLLDVEPKAGSEDWVSQAVAEEMAQGVCWMFECEMGVATTGYAEPDAAKGVTTPFAWWAVCGPDGVERSGRVEGTGLGRTQMQAKVAGAALRGLLAVLREKRYLTPSPRGS